MKHKFLFFLILSLALAPARAKRFKSGPLELKVDPAKAPEPADKYALIPKADKLTDADAVPLYEKAVEAMAGGRKQEKQIQEWLALPPEQLPQEQVEATIQKNLASLRLLARAARCKQCNWPKSTPGTAVAATSGYRNLGFLVRLWMRLEIVRGQYDSALLAMQTGFGMARHVGQGPTTIQALVGTAIGGLTCREVELFIQGKGSPNLYWALANLPRPLVDVAKAIESEQANAKGIRNFLLRKQAKKVVDPAYERMLLIEKRFGNNLNVMQCVEAIRHYAATHDGRLPEKLSDITDLELPKDVVTDKPFEYRRTAKGAVVQSKIPEGGDAADITRYEVVLKR
ncbi:MAG: hypothetical protein JSW59_00755 [Phycisphaerales bacterium]|nr:MAG: hypothetical protein JSW59_00755 [Phycisphaerales bacterium]